MGGRVLVEDPRGAAAPAMPTAALATGCVDFALSPDRLGHALLALCSATGGAVAPGQPHRVVDVGKLTRNRLLAMVPEHEQELLAPEYELVSLDPKANLSHENEPIEYDYFPISGVLSLVSRMEDGRAIDVATVGREGMVGLPVFLQATLTSAQMAFAQIPGEWRASEATRWRSHPAPGTHPTCLELWWTSISFRESMPT